MPLLQPIIKPYKVPFLFQFLFKYLLFYRKNLIGIQEKFNNNKSGNKFIFTQLYQTYPLLIQLQIHLTSNLQLGLPGIVFFLYFLFKYLLFNQKNLIRIYLAIRSFLPNFIRRISSLVYNQAQLDSISLLIHNQILSSNAFSLSYQVFSNNTF